MAYSGNLRAAKVSKVFLVLWTVLTVISAFNCHPKCNCIWRNGKQTAECSGVGFNAVPSELASGVQVLNISKNKIRILHRDAFLQVGLVNLQKVFLSHCDIDQVNEYAFNRLTNLVELDLSYNKLTIIPSASFIHVPRLRELKFSGNLLSTLPNHAFSSAKALKSLELSNCHIHTITANAFNGLENLQVLRIDNNNLETVSGKVMISLKSLDDISLYDNPWRCDCKLRSFRQWLDENNIPYTPPKCHQPLHVKNKKWDLIKIDHFSCPPEFLNTSSVVTVYENANVTLECRVTGDPSPTIKWVWRQRTIGNFSEGISSQQSFVVSETGQRDKLSRLKITFVQDSNAGTYSCITENLAGLRIKNFTLVISRHPVTEKKITDREKPQEVREKSTPVQTDKEKKGDSGSTIGMIIGIIFGALLVILIFTVLLWILRKRQRKSGSHKRQDVSHKLGNSVGSNDVKEQQEDVDLTLLDTNIMEKPSRLGAYEGLPTSDLDSYDPLTRDIGLSPNVWVVNDHMPAKPNWENPLKPEFSFHIPPPPHVEKRLSVRSPIPVPMPVPPCDLHSRLQNELADTFRRRDEYKPFERERGDGSSEMKPHEHENDPKELPKQDPDDDILNKLLSPLKSEENAPDLLSRPHQVIEPTPVIENPSAYFRPIQDVTSQNKGDKTPEVFEGGVDGTEV